MRGLLMNLHSIIMKVIRSTVSSRASISKALVSSPLASSRTPHNKAMVDQLKAMDLVKVVPHNTLSINRVRVSSTGHTAHPRGEDRHKDHTRMNRVNMETISNKMYKLIKKKQDCGELGITVDHIRTHQVAVKGYKAYICS